MAWLFAQAFWDAGVPKEALQVIITDRDALKVLTSAPAIKHIILTGGTDTAQNVKLLKLYLAIENTLYLCIKDKINNEKSYRLYSCFY